MGSLLRRFLVSTAVTLATFMLIAIAGHAQSAVSGSISGTVSDSTGAVIPGATVTITNSDRGAVIRVLKTGAAGFYTAGSLPLGTYKVTVAAPGFKTEAVTGLGLHAADTLTVNRTLTPGGTSEIVTVTSGSAQLNLEDATSAGLINSTQMSEMPLITRNYEVIMTLQPGIAFGGGSDELIRGPSAPSGQSSTANFSVNGGRNTSNSWTIDGSDNLDRGANLTLYTYPSPDAIAELKVLRGQYSAAYGRNASGQVDVVTKSGSNDIHGSAYEYARNNDFNANGYANNFLGQKIAPYHYNVFGFSFGGPVEIPKLYNGKNKTFFFVSQEWQRWIYTLTQQTATVPLPSELNGDFSQSYSLTTPGGVKTWTQQPVTVCTGFTTNTATQTNTCTGTGTKVTNMSPTAQQYLKDIYSKIPAPNPAYDIAHSFDPHTIFTNFKDQMPNSDTMVRIDQQIGQKANVFYRYLHDTFPYFYPAGQFNAVYIAGMNPTTAQNPGTQHLAHGTYIVNPTLVLDAGYAFSNGNIMSQSGGYLSQSQSPDVKPSLAYANTTGVVSTVSVSGMTSLNGSYQYVDHGTNHQVFANLTKTQHTHTLTFGFSYNHYQKRENLTPSSTQGSFGFNNDGTLLCTPAAGSTCGTFAIPSSDTSAGMSQAFANFLIGNASNGFSQSSANPIADIKSALYEGFAQDDWKVIPRLTINVGVRYGYYSQPWDANGILSNFNPATYSASKAPTIDTTGLMCVTGTCNQTGSNAGQTATPNASADIVGINYINGLIFNGPNAANNNQASSWGKKVGSAQKTNLAPRFGFAYDLFGDGKTSLRGGYGIAFDDPEVSYYETTDWDNPPAVANYSVGQTTFDNPTGGATTAFSKIPGRVQAPPLSYSTPYVQQYSLDIQRQVTPSLMIDVGYFGDHGTHLLGGMDINQPAPGAWVGKVSPSNSNPNATPSSVCVDPDINAPAFLNSTCDQVLNQIKPYLGYFAVDALRSIFGSSYSSLQAKARKSFKGKTYIDANYTWSKDLTNAQNDYSTFVQNIYNINGDYGRAAVDRKQVLSVDGVLEEPWFREQKNLMGRALGGWEISGLYAANSGLPLTATASGFSLGQYNLPSGVTGIYNGRTNTGYATDNAGISVLGNTSAGLRPDMIGNPNSGHGVQIHNKGYHQLWFYTGAFASPNPATNTSAPGNEHRGTINGPGFGTLDLGIFRNFRIVERVNFQFRAEAMNATNHTNVQSVTTSEGTYFGEVTGYRDARIMQFAGKFTF